MTKQITTLQAMQHPDVVETINVLSSMNQRLQDEIDELKAALFWLEPPQRPWVGLTDAEIVDCGWCDLRFARNIEAKLKEKNT